MIVVLEKQYSNLTMRAAGGRARTAATKTAQNPVVTSIRNSGGTGITRLVSVDAVAAKVSAAEVTRLGHNPAVKEIAPDLPIAIGATHPVPHVDNSASAEQQALPGQPEQAVHRARVAPRDAVHGRRAQPGPGRQDRQRRGRPRRDRRHERAGRQPRPDQADGSHVVIDSPTPNADASNDEAYGDATSVAGQGTVVYDYSKELPFSGLPAGCTFVMEGDAPGASLIDASLVDTPTDADGFMHQSESQVIAGIDNAVIVEHADVISESFGFTQRPGRYSVFYAANDAAVAAGVTVVVSSGDSGDSGTMSSPSTDPLVIEAGATNTLRLNAQAYGYTQVDERQHHPAVLRRHRAEQPLVDLVAPGYGGEAECNPAGSGCPTNTTTEAFGGTSQSAPLDRRRGR